MDAAAGVVLGDLDPASAAVPDDPPLADAVGAVASVDDSVLPAPDHTVDADILRFPALLWTEYGFPAAKCPYPATIYPEISSFHRPFTCTLFRYVSIHYISFILASIFYIIV